MTLPEDVERVLNQRGKGAAMRLLNQHHGVPRPDAKVWVEALHYGPAPALSKTQIALILALAPVVGLACAALNSLS